MSSSQYHYLLTRILRQHCFALERKFLNQRPPIRWMTKEKDPPAACGGEKIQNLVQKLREKTPIGKLDELDEGKHPYQEKEPLPPFPGGVNPETGEVGGPKGPEPTRYGDWERKGRVTDF